MNRPRSAIRALSCALAVGFLAFLAATPAVAGSHRIDFVELRGSYDDGNNRRVSFVDARVGLPFRIDHVKLEIDAVSACGGNPACDPPSGFFYNGGSFLGGEYDFTSKTIVRREQSFSPGLVVYGNRYVLQIELGSRCGLGPDISGLISHCPSAPFTIKKAVLIVSGQRVPGPWSRQQRGCANALTRAFSKLVDVRDRQIQDCIGRGAQQKLPTTIESCLASDPKGRLAKAMARTERVEAKLCSETLPDFGFRDAGTVNGGAPPSSVDVMRSVLGPDLDLAIADESTSEDVSACQQGVIKALGRWQKAKLESFHRCQKQGLRGGSIQSAVELGECLGECLGEDPWDQARAACDPPPERVRAALEKRCQGVDLPEAFPGIAAMPGCGTNDPAAVAACLDQSVECQICLAMNGAGALERDCDELDDGALNGSCL